MAAQGTEDRGPGAEGMSGVRPPSAVRGGGWGRGQFLGRPPGGSFGLPPPPLGSCCHVLTRGWMLGPRGQDCPIHAQGFWQVGHKSVPKLGGSPGGPWGRGAPGTCPALTGPLRPQLL